MEKEARQFLRRMISDGGFVADGLYESHPRYWRSNNSHSSRMIDLSLLAYLTKNGYLRRDKTGRLLVTHEGKHFAKPWYKRWFELA
jgi:hypothetical protein